MPCRVAGRPHGNSNSRATYLGQDNLFGFWADLMRAEFALPAVKPADRLGPDSSIWPMIALAFAGLVAIQASGISAVWHTGFFGDSDDAMRMSQVRDWMAGQSWYDLHAHRLGLPGSPVMHWSRLVDIPIAALVTLFQLCLEPTSAERAARLAFSGFLQLALLVVAARAAQALAGRRAVAPALMIVAASGLVFGQFRAGRIDHHAPQIILLGAICLLMIRMIGRRGTRGHGFVCGLLMSLSIAISIENLPMIFAATAVLAGSWLVDGPARSPALEGLAAGLAFGLIFLFVSTVPPERWLETNCDSNSIVYSTLGLAGAFGCFVLTRLPARFCRPAARCVALGILSAMLGALLWFAFPSCAGDPYLHVDPVVRRLWLSHVVEARPLVLALHESPGQILPSLLPALLGLAGAIVGSFAETGPKRRAWMVIAVVGLAALATTWWKIAAISGFVAVAGLGLLWPLERLQRVCAPYGPVASRWAAILGALVISPVAVAAMMPASAGGADRGIAMPRACFDPKDYRALRDLPPGRIFAPLDMGAHLLAQSHHSVVAAPYHRNNEGNRLVLEGFAGDLSVVRESVRRSGADYLVVCAFRFDASFEGRLSLGDAFDWLDRLPSTGGILIFRVQK